MYTNSQYNIMAAWNKTETVEINVLKQKKRLCQCYIFGVNSVSQVFAWSLSAHRNPSESGRLSDKTKYLSKPGAERLEKGAVSV